MATPDVFYKEAMEHCQTYNSRLMTERRIRLPYLDSQTRVAQNDCCLWLEKRHRGPGLLPNQVYSYASKRWKKRPRFIPLQAEESHYETNSGPQRELRNGKCYLPMVEPVSLISENSNDSSSLNALTAAMMDEDTMDSTSAITHPDEFDLDLEEDFEMRAKRKSKRSQRGTVRSAAKKVESLEEKTHSCPYCGKKYKNRPGMNYHIQHMHPDEVDADEEYTPTGRHTPSSIMSDDHHSTSSRASAVAAQKVTPSTASSEIVEPESMETRPKRKRQTAMNDYCDFCLGDADENKKTGTSEELVSCADCGRSGHPTCLQFTDIMTMNVKKYSWQCIECKSCHLCGTSDNDEQLLFCDDCDRGYHMYCLQPPMQSPPEGSWICNLCEADRKERERNAAAISL